VYANKDFVVLGSGLFDVLDLNDASAMDSGLHVHTEACRPPSSVLRKGDFFMENDASNIDNYA
jgi:hypothetical protein